MLDNFKGNINKSKNKYINNTIRCAKKEVQLAFLRTAFKGDGFVDSGRCGFITSSRALAKGYQDLLLQNSIWSRIDTENRGKNRYYKVAVVGTQSFKKFNEKIVEQNDKRLSKLKNFYLRSKKKKNERDIIHRGILVELNDLLKSFGLSDGYFFTSIKKGYNAHRDTVSRYIQVLKHLINKKERVIHQKDTKKIRRSLHIPIATVTKQLSVSHATIYNIEKQKGTKKYSNLLKILKEIAVKKVSDTKSRLKRIERWFNANIRFLSIKKVERVKDDSVKWVYDVRVEPTRTFISEGLALHNTVSISKANIQATLVAKTTVLAAANPKFGRFDPYGIIAEQIDLPPTLINRFDLIFTVKDFPDEKKDGQLASHILNLHQSPDVQEPDIETQLLKKYIGYAKRKINPKLSDGALAEIKKYYLKMRASGSAEEGIRTIPISPRQLEALVRLSEANARIRLSNEVTKKDAKKAIALLEYCLMDVGFDKETGKIDIDRIATGVSASVRSHILTVKEIISELEGKIGKTIPIDDVVAISKERGVEEDKVEEVLEKLKRTGDLFEPKHGFVSRI